MGTGGSERKGNLLQRYEILRGERIRQCRPEFRGFRLSERIDPQSLSSSSTDQWMQ